MSPLPPRSDIILSSRAALACWRDVRKRSQAGNSTPERQERLREAMYSFSTQYLWPLRILVEAPSPNPRFLLVMNWGGQGNDEDLWEMRGWHREQDIIRLAVRFRNIYLAGHRSHAYAGQVDSGLMHSMENVRRLMTIYGHVDSDDTDEE